jgi:phosphoribosyl 1,2-cyclic phosphodiesterase
MKVKFWGVRGSLPSPGPETCRYGGNTPCVELRADDQLIILDAGTGIRKLGNALQREWGDRPINGTILISHTHWDHIHGLPFFGPAFVPQNRFVVYGCAGSPRRLKAVFSRQMKAPYSPLTLSDLRATLEFRELSEEEIRIGDVRVRSMFVNHPGMTLGFRIESGKRSLVYATDHEPDQRDGPAAHGGPDPIDRLFGPAGHQDRKLALFAAETDLLICDAQYTPEEYKAHVRWGHSSTEDALEMALRARARRLALFHHDPDRSDCELDRLVGECRGLIAQTGAGLECFAAQEGVELSL